MKQKGKVRKGNIREEACNYHRWPRPVTAMRYYTHSLYNVQLWLFGTEVYIQKDSVCAN